MQQPRPDTTHPALCWLSSLLDFASPPGREERVAAFVQEKVRALGFEAEVDGAGNVVVPLHGAGEPGGWLIAAHLDEIALVVSRIEADGTLRVVRSGGMAPGKMGERPVEIVGDRGSITGVLSSGGGHRADRGVRPLEWSDYWVITGLSPEQLRERGIHVGAGVVPAREGRGPVVFGDEAKPLVGAWTFDDRMGVVALLRLLESVAREKPAFTTPVTIAFTVHEEGGAHGAKGLAHRLRSRTFLAVDGYPILPGSGVRMEGGPVVWVKDLKTNYTHSVILSLEQAATAAGVNLQRAVLENGYSDASAVYDTGGAERVGIVGHFRENSHGFEVAPLRVFDETLAVLEALVRGELAR